MGGLILLITLAIYFPALRGGFIWDDRGWITENKTLGNGSGLLDLWIHPVTFDSHLTFDSYHLLTQTSLWLDHFFWKFVPLGYHLTNILFHSANSVLLGLILTSLSVPGAWLASALFAVHPVNVESVAWITERKNVLSLFFYLLAMGAYLRSYRLGRAPLLAFGFFACALLSKTVTCTLPFALLVILWWKNGRLRWPDVFPLVPFIILGSGIGLSAAWTDNHTGVYGPDFNWSLIDRVLIAGRVFWFYLGKIFWPCPVSYIYPKWAINTGVARQYFFPLGAVGFLIALWKFRLRLGKGPLSAFLFFVITLAPGLGFVNANYMRISFVADHWQYHAMIAPLVLFACLVSQKSARLLRFALGGSILAVLSLLTWNQAHIYKDEETFWRYNLAKNPGAWIVHYNLGVVYQQKGRLAEAVDAYTNTLRLKPDYPEAHNNLGLILNRLGYEKEAFIHFQEAVRNRPDYSAAHTNLAIALAQQGKWKEAVTHFSKAFQLEPQHERGLYNLQLAMAKQNAKVI